MPRYQKVMTYKGLDGVPCYRIGLVREEGVQATVQERVRVDGPDVVEKVCADMADEPAEHFDVLCLDTKGGLIARVNVTIGTLSATVIAPRDVFKVALAANAASVVIVHNHPSGVPTPSSADIDITRRIIRAGKMLGVDVLDHVIVAAGGTYSMRNSGTMPSVLDMDV